MVFDLDMIRALYAAIPARIAEARNVWANPLHFQKKYCITTFIKTKNPTLVRVFTNQLSSTQLSSKPRRGCQRWVPSVDRITLYQT
ncbi:MAG: hypothetical protein IM606_06230 [Cytophagales bacterium]|jgi:hypothetical protein|nr:hypothetical protein [Cytophagales bacterium]MCA6389680.1 hypothetical protein [Cytophagales bacterium]MCA6391333.1 hypothetical protein [Cytophagales bacterium]MCA6394769.1 hypothetical protein [Cytophagales bacterium]MCA6398254.1 hypothetical protein [Cytophagales bacterium]